MSSKKHLLFFTVVLLAFGYIVFYSDSDEDQIRAVIRDIEALISYQGESHPFEQLANAKAVSMYCVEECRIVALTTQEEREIVSDRNELQQKMLMVYRALNDLRVKASSIRLDITGASATVTFQGSATGTKKGRSEQFLEEHDIVVEWEKRGSDWLILSARNKTPIEVSAEYEH